MKFLTILLLSGLLGLNGCHWVSTPNPSSLSVKPAVGIARAPALNYPAIPKNTQAFLVVSRSAYAERLQGFWLGQSIANWTGLITEMDKVKPPFYTQADWGKSDEKNIWGDYVPHANRINFYFEKEGAVWGADDDTDMEYMYQTLLEDNKTALLTPQQIKAGWLKHIYSNEDAPFYQKFPNNKPQRENFLWVSNETAYTLMQNGLLPPNTSEPDNNPHFNMIDAQLTTEIFGMFSPGHVDTALKIAHLPIRTTAKNESEAIAEFYVAMHALSAVVNKNLTMAEQMQWLGEQAKKVLPEGSYPAKMYAFVKTSYQQNPNKNNWEVTRDAIYDHYQASSHDGYVYKESFDAGINFAASLVSLFYGQGDLKRTIQLGSLCGWDSDNPTATWGGLMGSLMGKTAIEQAFGVQGLSDTYWIHRTRRQFADRTPQQQGEDTFTQMAQRGVQLVDRVVIEQMGGYVDIENDRWLIPKTKP